MASQQHFDPSQLIESAPDAIVVADRDGVIRLWNPAAEALLGHRATDMVGQPLDAMIPERFRERHWAAFNAAVENGHFANEEPAARPSRALLADGETMIVDLMVSILRDGDAVTGIMSTLRRREPRD